MEVIESDELVFIDKSTIGQSEVGESIQIPPESVADAPQTPLPDDLHRNSSLITLDATPSGEVQFHLPLVCLFKIYQLHYIQECQELV